jgi:mercuric ion binding protein
MRGIAYAIAAIIAVGIMIGIAKLPEPSASDDSMNVASTPVSVTPNVMQEAGMLTLSVPEMHCAFACYPKVKESLESSQGVQGVELAEQQEEGAIDNRQVIVTYEAGFDVTTALALLTKKGFADSDLVQ